MSSSPLSPRRAAAGLTVSALLIGTVAATAAPASAAQLPTAKASSTKQPLSKALAAAKGTVNVLVETTGTAPTRAYAAARGKGVTAARSAERSAQASSAKRVSDLRAKLAPKGRVLFSNTRVVPGVALRTDAANLKAIAALPGVAKVVPLTEKTRSNARSDELTQAIATWTQTDNIGTGVTVGVIDTGIDYTHADFGGGGIEDFASNDTTVIPGEDGSEGDVAFPTDKVIGGYDFAGDDYDGGNDPTPDSDPLDCATELGGGHGTHVSGTVAGFGVTSAGETFDGDYSTLTPAQAKAMNIGPGAAPGAKLVGLRVFGCGGGTLLVSQALDYVAGLNTDDDPANDVNILNLSLGSGFTRGDDPDAQAIDAITDLGVLPVISAGNDGDLYGAVGSPGSARKALTVAATDDGVDTVDGVKVSIDGTDTSYPATNSIAYPYRSQPADNVGTLVKLTQPDNLDGCSTLSATDAAALVGKYAFLEWDDNDTTRRCGSAGRAARVKAAGAVGAVYGSNALRFSAGITGDADIPVTLTNSQGADAIRAALTADKTVMATFGFNYRAGTALGQQVVDLPSTDSIADFTSRGGTPADGYLKPDVGAPGLHTFSANSGTGNEGLDESGTSMASPHTAGVAALTAAAHPTWTPEELKAGVMNTANGLLTTDGHGAGTPYTVSRVGAGRVNALNAVSNDVVAFVASDPGAVGLGFGPVAVTAPTTRSKTVTVENFGDTAATYALTYVSAQDVPGVTFTTSVPSVTVPAGDPDEPGTTSFTVTMAVTSVSALRKTPDPTIELQQGGLDRQFATEENGRIVLTPAEGLALLLPAAVAPRPASTMHAASSSVGLLKGAHDLATGTVALTGHGVSNGEEGDVDAVQSLVGGFQLQANSPALSACLPSQVDGCIAFPSQRAGDLQYVGAAVGNGLLGIALTTRGTFSQPAYNPGTTGVSGEVAYFVTIDTDGNGSPDREIDVTRYAADTDVYVAETYDFVTGDLLDDEYLNSVPASIDSNAINSNAMILPVALDALSLPPDRSKISYTVYTQSLDDLGSTLDAVGPLTFDTAHPAVSVAPQLEDSLLSADLPGSLPVVGDSAGDGTENLGLLLMHLHNTDGAKAEVLSTSTTLDPSLSTYTPTAPARLVDSRSTGHRITAAHVIDVPVAGTHGIPADATAVALSVTALNPTAASDVKAYPTGSAVPVASNLNLVAGRNASNTVVVKLGSGGKVRLRNGAGAVDLVADLQGYYTKGLDADSFVAAAPHRVLDTRTSGGAVAAGATKDLKVNGVGGLAGAPADATAVVLDVTAVNPAANGFLQVYPKSTAAPGTANAAFTKAVDVTTLVVAKLGTDGSIRFRPTYGATNVVADVVGYYVPSGAAAFVPTAVSKVLDTRSGLGVPAGKIAAGATRDLTVAGIGPVPADATSVVLNLTGLGATAKTFVAAYPVPASGSAVPTVTDLNVAAGVVVPNLAIIPIGKDGKVRFRNAASPVDLVAYVTGYYTG
jgi:subtilisin family serine protease